MSHDRRDVRAARKRANRLYLRAKQLSYVFEHLCKLRIHTVAAHPHYHTLQICDDPRGFYRCVCD